MANGSLRGQTLPCPMCSRSIAIPSLTPQEQQGPIELQALPSNAPAQPYPAYDEFGSPVEYQLAPIGDNGSLPLHMIALNSTMDVLASPVDEMSTRTLPPAEKPIEVPSSSRFTPKSTPRGNENAAAKVETPYQELISGVFMSFMTLLVTGLFFFYLDYLEQQPGQTRFRAPWYVVLIYAIGGKIGILVAGILFATFLMSLSVFLYLRRRHREAE